MQITDLGPARPPCSAAERDMGVIVQRHMRRGLRPSAETFRAPTSPTWAPLLRALLRVWAAAFLAAAWPTAAIVLASIAVLAGIRWVAGLLRFVPLLGARSVNIVASRRGKRRDLRPLVVVAHLDTHPTGGAPLTPLHAFLASASGWLALAGGVVAEPGAWRTVAALIAIEAIATLAWMARRELVTPSDPPDDNTSGLLALVRLSELVADGTQLRDTWLVATGAGTSGSYGVRTFLRRRRDLRRAWIVEIDALGVGEVVASPFPSRFPYPGTPNALIRAVTAAARATGDPMTVRPVRRPHSDARTALRQRTGAIAFTGGHHPPSGGTGPDAANAERAARVADQLARLPD